MSTKWFELNLQEMKKLEPMEADHSKLKANFAGLRNFAAILCACEILLSASRYLRPTFFDILLQIFVV